MVASRPGLPVLVFDESVAPAEHQFELFHETTAPAFDTVPAATGEPFAASAVDYLVDDLIVSRLEYGSQTLRRTARHLRTGYADGIAVLRFHRGGLWGHVDDDEVLEAGPDRVALVDQAHSFAAWAARTDVTWILIPRHRVRGGRDLPLGGPVRHLDRWSVAGRVLMASIDELWRRLGRARADEAADLAAGFVDTLDGVLEPAGAIPTDRGLAAAMEAHVAANLDDLDLGVDALRATFHCSRSAVYRLFEPHGGVAAYIRELRLLRCFEELSRPAKLPRRVSEVATRWGFDNPSHFHRLFTAKFGLPPSGLRGSVGPGWEVPVPPAAAGMVQRFHSWTTAI